MGLTLIKISESSSTITLGWTPPANVGGYVFYANGQVVSVATKNLKNGSPRNQVQYSKTNPGPPFEVVAVVYPPAVDFDKYPDAPDPDPDPGPGTPIPTSGRITAGGTYSGSYTGAGPIVIDTSELVTISGATITITSDGDVFRGLGGGFTIRKLRLERCVINGRAGRMMDTDGDVDLIEVFNCTIEKTSGMKFSVVQPGAVIRVLRNRAHNIQGGGGNLTQFTQWNGTTGGTFEVAWNEVVNDDPDGSFMEDVLSLHGCDGVYVHDNLIDGQWNPGNSPDSSQGGITLEENARNCRVEDNTLIATAGGFVINYNVGANNSVLRNRLVRSGYYPDGVTKAQIGYSGLAAFPGAPGRSESQNGNHAHDNVIGFMAGAKHGFFRSDWEDDDLPADCLGRNQHFAPVGAAITQAHEQAERVRWQQKKQAAGITVGA